MTLSQKETTLLNDLKGQEQICIEKYRKYEEQAHDPALKEIFSSLRTTEEGHLSTICRILNGEEVTMSSSSPKAAAQKYNGTPSSVDEEKKKQDAFLCKDALSMEKHVSSVYDTAIFEFCSPVLRDTLAHIQKEEQDHGEKLYSYMSASGMYQ